MGHVYVAKTSSQMACFYGVNHVPAGQISDDIANYRHFHSLWKYSANIAARFLKLQENIVLIKLARGQQLSSL